MATSTYETNEGNESKITQVSSLKERLPPQTLRKGLVHYDDQLYVSNGTKYLKLNTGQGLTLVASNCGLATDTNAGNKQISARSRHRIFATTDTITLGWWTGYVTGGFETSPPAGNQTYFAHIEDRDGTIIGTATWANGAESKTVSSNTLIFTDPIQLSRPLLKGEMFFVTSFVESTGGIVFTRSRGCTNSGTGAIQPTGESVIFAASGVQNRVLAKVGGGFINQSAYVINRPTIILADSEVQSFALFGDSRVGMDHNNATDGYGFNGEVTPSIGKDVPVLPLNIGGVQIAVDSGPTTTTIRRQLAEYCSGLIFSYGINDLSAGRTAIQVLADSKTLRDRMPAKPAIICTISPRTDAGNTTPEATSNAQRLLCNASIRLIPTSFSVLANCR